MVIICVDIHTHPPFNAELGRGAGSIPYRCALGKNMSYVICVDVSTHTPPLPLWVVMLQGALAGAAAAGRRGSPALQNNPHLVARMMAMQGGFSPRGGGERSFGVGGCIDAAHNIVSSPLPPRSPSLTPQALHRCHFTLKTPITHPIGLASTPLHNTAISLTFHPRSSCRPWFDAAPQHV